jgi:hypothetical protein
MREPNVCRKVYSADEKFGLCIREGLQYIKHDRDPL